MVDISAAGRSRADSGWTDMDSGRVSWRKVTWGDWAWREGEGGLEKSWVFRERECGREVSKNRVIRGIVGCGM